MTDQTKEAPGENRELCSPSSCKLNQKQATPPLRLQFTTVCNIKSCPTHLEVCAMFSKSTQEQASPRWILNLSGAQGSNIVTFLMLFLTNINWLQGCNFTSIQTWYINIFAQENFKTDQATPTTDTGGSTSSPDFSRERQKPQQEKLQSLGRGSKRQMTHIGTAKKVS